MPTYQAKRRQSGTKNWQDSSCDVLKREESNFLHCILVYFLICYEKKIHTELMWNMQYFHELFFINQFCYPLSEFSGHNIHSVLIVVSVIKRVLESIVKEKT